MKIWQENSEPIPSIKFSTNPTETGFTEITSIPNYFKYGLEYGLTKHEVLQYSIEEVVNWSTEAQANKDLIINFIQENTFTASITTEIRADITAPYKGFEIFNTTTSKSEWWNGSTWDTTGGGGVSRNNHVLVKSVADLPAPSGGKHVLDDNYSYELNGTIVLGTNYIEAGVSNVIYGVDKSDDGIVYTGTGGAIRSASKDLSISKIFIVASTVGGKAYDITGNVASTNKVEISECIFTSCDKVGSAISSFEAFIFRNNLIQLCSDGVNFTDANDEIVVTDNILINNLGTFTGYSFATATYDSIIISRNLFEVSATQTAISTGTITFLNGGILSNNTFSGLGTYLNGFNGNTSGWHIPYKSNLGYVGLIEQSLNWGADGAFGTTSTVNLSPIVTTSSFAEYGKNITEIKCVLQASVTHQQSGQTIRIEINDVTNGNVAVAGSTVDFVVPVANTYYNLSTPEVTLNPSNEYNIKVTRLTGSGNNLAGARSATWKVKAF